MGKNGNTDWFEENAPAPSTPDSSQGDWFAANAPTPPSGATGTISSIPSGPASWLEQLEGDIRSGSGFTLPGRILQKLGAKGIGQEGSPGETLTSPILGPIHAAQGVVDKDPVRGAKKVVGGALETLTLPAAFVAPEAGEAASKATVGIGKNLTAGGRRQLLSQAVTKTLNNLVKTEGLQPIEAKTATEAVANLADQFRSRAKQIYQAVDKAVGGELQPVLDKIEDLGKAAKANRALDPEKADLLNAQRNELLQRKAELVQKAATNGVSDAEKAIDIADRDWTRYRALNGKVGQQIKTAAGEVRRGGHPDPKAFAVQVDRLNNTGNLQKGLGGQTAEEVKSAAKSALKKEKVASGVKKGLIGLGSGGVLYGAKEALGNH